MTNKEKWVIGQAVTYNGFRGWLVEITHTKFCFDFRDSSGHISRIWFSKDSDDLPEQIEEKDADDGK